MNAEALEAAAHWGGAKALRVIGDRENSVYEALLPQGRAALRLHRIGYQTEASIRSELWWCEALAMAGVAVPRPLAALDGEMLHRLSTGRLASVIAWIDGEALGEAGVPLAGNGAEQIARHHELGALLAGLHDATDALRLPDGFIRPRWDLPGLLGDTPFWGRFWDHVDLTPSDREIMIAVRQHLVDVIGHHARDGDFGLIHADVLRENILVAPGGLSLIDFDDAGFGFRLYDLGTSLSQSLREPLLPELAAALVAGYASIRPLRPEDRALIPAFTLMRCCASVGWTMPRLAPGHPGGLRHIDRAIRLAREVLEGTVAWTPD